jgi:hypothetical protein
MNPIRHIVIAMTLSIATFIVAGDRWNERIKSFKPVKAAPK